MGLGKSLQTVSFLIMYLTRFQTHKVCPWTEFFQWRVFYY